MYVYLYFDKHYYFAQVYKRVLMNKLNILYFVRKINFFFHCSTRLFDKHRATLVSNTNNNKTQTTNAIMSSEKITGKKSNIRPAVLLVCSESSVRD